LPIPGSGRSFFFSVLFFFGGWGGVGVCGDFGGGALASADLFRSTMASSSAFFFTQRSGCGHLSLFPLLFPLLRLIHSPAVCWVCGCFCRSLLFPPGTSLPFFPPPFSPVPPHTCPTIVSLGRCSCPDVPYVSRNAHALFLADLFHPPRPRPPGDCFVFPVCGFFRLDSSGRSRFRGFRCTVFFFLVRRLLALPFLSSCPLRSVWPPPTPVPPLSPPFFPALLSLCLCGGWTGPAFYPFSLSLFQPPVFSQLESLPFLSFFVGYSLRFFCFFSKSVSSRCVVVFVARQVRCPLLLSGRTSNQRFLVFDLFASWVHGGPRLSFSSVLLDTLPEIKLVAAPRPICFFPIFLPLGGSGCFPPTGPIFFRTCFCRVEGPLPFPSIGKPVR